VQLTDLKSGTNLIQAPLPSIWVAEAVIKGAAEGVTVALDGSAGGAARSYTQPAAGALVLTWAGIPLPGTSSKATVTVTIVANGTLFQVSRKTGGIAAV
jgi:hypothetical protein